MVRGKSAGAPSEQDETVEVKKGPQDGELPGITASDRKIQEIEDLADVVSGREDEATAAREELKNAKENLVASMKRHERSTYSRKTWGTVTMKHSDSVRVKKEDDEENK